MTSQWIINLHLIYSVCMDSPCISRRIETTRERVQFEGQLCRVYQTPPPPLTASPYYYCHDKGLAPQSVAKSEIPLFPPPREDLCGFFHRLPDRSACGDGGPCRSRIREKSGFIFRFVPAALRCRDGICPAGAPRSLPPPPSSHSQHLKQQECRVNFHFLFSAHFQIIFVYILDSGGESAHSHLSKNFCRSLEN